MKHSEHPQLTIIPKSSTFIGAEWLLVFVFIALALTVSWTVSSWLRDPVAQAASENAATKISRSGELEVTFIDVGSGDSALIRTPNGHVVLVDAGQGRGEYTYYDAGLQTVVPLLKKKGISRIDTMIMTHPHFDHYGGMDSVLDHIEVGEFLDPGLAYGSFAYENLLKKIKEKKIPFKLIKAPQILSWDPAIFVQVLWPETEGYVPDDPNNNSITFRLVHGDIVYLFTGDIEQVVEEQLYAYGGQLRTTILKIPHHGSATSSTPRLLKLLQPRLAVFSLGRNNRFGHPDREIVQRYNSMKIKSLRTDQDGTIQTFSNGQRVLVQPEHSAPFSIFPFPD